MRSDMFVRAPKLEEWEREAARKEQPHGTNTRVRSEDRPVDSWLLGPLASPRPYSFDSGQARTTESGARLSFLRPGERGGGIAIARLPRGAAPVAPGRSLDG